MPAKEKETKRIKPVVEVVEEPIEETTTTEETEPSTITSSEEAPTESSTDTENIEVVEEVVEVPASETSAEPQEEVVEEVVVEDDTPATETAVEKSTPVTEVKNEEKPIKTVEHKMSIKTILAITIVSALVAAFVSGGVYVYLNGVSQLKSNTEESTETDSSKDDSMMEEDTSPTPEPTEAPTVSEDLTVYTIQVLNGSGEIGAASSASQFIEDGGFVVEDTGNADSYDYEETVVQYKKGVNEADLNALVTALEESYTVKSESTLTDDSEYDFVVIVGTD